MLIVTDLHVASTANMYAPLTVIPNYLYHNAYRDVWTKGLKTRFLF